MQPSPFRRALLDQDEEPELLASRDAEREAMQRSRERRQ
jgi:hypothetical protein